MQCLVNAVRWCLLVMVLMSLGCTGGTKSPPAMRGGIGSLPDSLVQEQHGGRFKYSVIRRMRSPDERALIEAAERLAPDTSLFRVNKLSTPYLPADPVDRWWSHSYGDTRVPFAITTNAVSYYRELWSKLAAQNRKDLSEVVFGYTAEVSSQLTPEGFRVVVMRMWWTEECHLPKASCHWGFDHDRRVYFDSSGKAIRVEGDKQTVVIAT